MSDTPGYDYTGYESAFVPTPPASPEVEFKTDKPSSNPQKEEASSAKSIQKYAKPKYKNVLNGYRSITYNFTLAGLPSDFLSNPDAYRQAELGKIILKSGGKGNSIISNINSLSTAQVASVEEEVLDKYSAQNNKRKAEEALPRTKSLIDGFNERSPGRFDMFIDNVEIDSLMTFSEESNVTLPTKIKFDVIEPYSINGFIEALHVAAVASGYTSYVNATFVLKVEFWGIPDSDTDEFKPPEKIKNADRYFPIMLTKVGLDISEKGAKYSCSAVPVSDRPFGQPSVIKKPIKMEGQTVKDILEKFIDSVNEQIKKSNQDAKASPINFDEYKIKFVDWDASKGWVESSNSEIAKSQLLNLFEDNILYSFAKHDQGKNSYKPGTEPKSIKYNPEKVVVNFPENKSIHEVISAVIRDSTYVRNLLKEMADKNIVKTKVDNFGRVKYFSIRIEVENKKEFDVIGKKFFQKFTFVVSPYKVHFTKIPTYGSVQLKEEEFARLSVREYNYYYMGQNVDVLGFKLNFNNLYFEAVPASMADQNFPKYRDSAKPGNDVKRKVEAPDKETQSNANYAHPMPPVREVVTPVQPADGSAVPIQNDPYSTMARSVHEAVVNSKASALTGDLEILGDPFYLVTGGMGSYNPPPLNGDENVLGQGEASVYYSEVNVTLNFRNPVDIQSFEQGGMMEFAPERVPFSGVYLVTKANSTFREGTFRQRLSIIRRPGQILDETTKEVGISSMSKVVPNEDDRGVSQPAEQLTPSLRLNQAGVDEYLNRGAPDVNNNFTGAVGGLDGASPLTRTYGLVSRDGSLKSAAGVIGQTIPTDVSSNIRLQVNNLADLKNNVLTSAALVNAAANVITGNKSLKTVASVIAGNVIGTALSTALKKSNPGSGIGEGATVQISPVSSTPLNPTANDIKFGAIENPLKLAEGSINNLVGLAKDLGSNAIDAVSRLGSDAANLVGGIKGKVDSTLAAISDPGAIAAKVGLDASKLSGLSNNLQSKLSSQLSKLPSLPENVNLSQSYDEGLALDVIPPSKFANIPPTTPYKVAPSPELAIAAGVAGASILKNITQMTNQVDKTVISDKINTVKTQYTKLTGQTNIVDSTVSGAVTTAFGSKSSTSPLSQLINKVNNSNIG